NGGLTPTMALATTNPPFCGGDPKAPPPPPPDQRGLPPLVLGRLDPGAFEKQTVLLPDPLIYFFAMAQPSQTPAPPVPLPHFVPQPVFSELMFSASEATTGLMVKGSGSETLSESVTSSQSDSANSVQDQLSLDYNFQLEGMARETVTL